ncbi:hypothetical protein BB560_003671, partial [Smittium megazygosporum]
MLQPLKLNVVKWGPLSNLLKFTATAIQASSSWLAIGHSVGSIAFFSIENVELQDKETSSKIVPKALILGHKAEICCLLWIPKDTISVENYTGNEFLLSICTDGKSSSDENSESLETLVCYTETGYIKTYQFDSLLLQRSTLPDSNSDIFLLQSSFSSNENSHIHPQIISNEFNTSEFLLLYKNSIRMFQFIDDELHEKHRWVSNSKHDMHFKSAHFVSTDTFILWNSYGLNTLVNFSLNGKDIVEDINNMPIALYIPTISVSTHCLGDKEFVSKGLFLNYYNQSGTIQLSIKNIVASAKNGSDVNSLLNSNEVEAKTNSDLVEYTSKEIVHNLNDIWTSDHFKQGSFDQVSCKLIHNKNYMILGLVNGDIIITDVINGLWPHNPGCSFYYDKPQVLQGHTAEITALFFLLSASKDLKICIHDLKLGTLLAAIPVLMSPINKFLVFDKDIIKNSKLKHKSYDSSVIESLVVCIGGDNSAAVISLLTIKVELVFPPSREPIISVHFDPKLNKLKVTYKSYSKLVVSLDFLSGYQIDDTVDEGLEFSWKQVSSGILSYPSDKPWLKLNSNQYLDLDTFSDSIPAAFEVIELDILEIEKSVSSEKLTEYQMGVLKVSFSLLHSWGLVESTDASISEILGIRSCNSKYPVSLANMSKGIFTVLFPLSDSPKSSWEQSSYLNSHRLLVLLIYIKIIFQGYEQFAVNLVNFYLTTLPKLIGQSFKCCDLNYLASYFLHEQNSLRDASRVLIYSQIKDLDSNDMIKLAEENSERVLKYASAVIHSSEQNLYNSNEAVVIISAVASHMPDLVKVNTFSALSALLSAALNGEDYYIVDSLRWLCIETLIIRNYELLVPFINCSQITRNVLLDFFMLLLEQGVSKKRNLQLKSTSSKNILGGSESKRPSLSKNNATATRMSRINSNHQARNISSKHHLVGDNGMGESSAKNGLNVRKKESVRAVGITRFLDTKFTMENGVLVHKLNLLKSALVHIFVVDPQSFCICIQEILYSKEISSHEINFIIQVLLYLAQKQPILMAKHMRGLFGAMLLSIRNINTNKNEDMKIYKKMNALKKKETVENAQIFGINLKSHLKKFLNYLVAIDIPHESMKQEMNTSCRKFANYVGDNFNNAFSVTEPSNSFCISDNGGMIDIYDMLSFELRSRVNVGNREIIRVSLDGMRYLATLCRDKEDMGVELSIWNLFDSRGVAINKPTKSMKIPSNYLDPIRESSPSDVKEKIKFVWKSSKSISLIVHEA